MVEQVVSPDQVAGVSGEGDQLLRLALNNANTNFNDLYLNKIFAAFGSTANVSNTSNAVLIADPNISCNVTVTGNYAFEGVMYVFGTANAFCGFAMAMNANTAVVNAFSWHSYTSANAAIGFIASNANNILTNTVYMSNISVTAAQPSFVDYKGFVCLNSVGTFGPAWASNISSANTVTRSANSWFKMTRVG